MMLRGLNYQQNVVDLLACDYLHRKPSVFHRCPIYDKALEINEGKTIIKFPDTCWM